MAGPLNFKHIMKQTIISGALFILCLSAQAQDRQQDRVNSSMLTYPVTPTRTEIVLPVVNGYKVQKVDLHTHTCYSDGSMTPSYRVVEGWQDGLDAMAITDHIEYRPNEESMAKYLADGVTRHKAVDGKISSDLNLSVSLAESRARTLGITIIPGTEITRDPVTTGHYNALFTKDNNLIPDSDPLQAIRNAKKQGAIVQCNHPGWRRTDNEFTSVAEAAIKEGLIDGVEVFNNTEFYPNVIETAVERNFYICAGSDLHQSSHDKYGLYGVYRDMTLVLANDNSLESIREALENRRTIAYAYGDLAGAEQLLKDFFLASFEFKYIATDSKGFKLVQITNKTSLPYMLTLPGFTVDMRIQAFSSIICKVKDASVHVCVMNMWYGDRKHPELDISL